MKSSFKNRIVLYNLTLITAILLIVFFVIHTLVYLIEYRYINDVLQLEVNDHQSEAQATESTNSFPLANEWLEKEHQEGIVNPIFVEFYSLEGKSHSKSPNLQANHLPFLDAKEIYKHKEIVINEHTAIEIQVPLKNKFKQPIGYVCIAYGTFEQERILNNIRLAFFIMLPLFLLISYFLTEFITKKGLHPFFNIIFQTSNIDKNNFTARITPSSQYQEIQQLTSSINHFLDQTEQLVTREKQFISDASHELKTPLAIIRGKLEVLIRKPRTQEEYTKKITDCLVEIDKLTEISENLLLISQIENHQNIDSSTIDLSLFLNNTIKLFSEKYQTKQFIYTQNNQMCLIKTNLNLFSIIINNIIDNACKYTTSEGVISIEHYQKNNTIICTITDNGVGIDTASIKKITQPFYRENNQLGKDGFGLGLAIVEKIALVLNISVQYIPQNRGLQVSLSIPLTHNEIKQK